MKAYIFLSILIFSLTLVSAQQIITIENQGGNMEGHTPRGFQGQGTGLFVGDNLNPGFPNGDGVQTFLTFDLSVISNIEIQSATLKTNNLHLSGTPFQDLGPLRVQEIRYDAFSSVLYNLQAISEACTFSDSIECDVTQVLKSSLNDNYQYAQFRILFEQAGDNDGQQDLAMFYIRDSNTNQPGIFELEITFSPNSNAPSQQSSGNSFPTTTVIIFVIIIALITFFTLKKRK